MPAIFDWDSRKDQANQARHGVSFADALAAFSDPRRIIAEDETHSVTEQRYFCFEELRGGIVTVRFTYRGGVIRVFGAGYWRKGKRIYEHENQLHERPDRKD